MFFDQQILDQDLRDKASAGDAEGVKELLCLGANPRAVSARWPNDTALCKAALNQHAECVAQLAPLSDPNQSTLAGTPLHFAARGGSAACVALLLPLSDPGALDNFGCTPLMSAANNGHAECVRVLLPASDANAQTVGGGQAGRNALMLAAASRGASTADLIEILAPKTRDLNATDSHGFNALMLAVRYGPDCLPGETPSWMTLATETAASARAVADGHTALDMAVAKEAWAAADFLAPFSPIESVQKAFEQGDSNKLPRCRSALERRALQQEVRKSGSGAAELTNEGVSLEAALSMKKRARAL